MSKKCKKLTQLRLMRPGDQVGIREQAIRLPNTYNSSIFPCNKCNFTCTRVNVIIAHIKSHQYDVPTKKKAKNKNLKNSKKRIKNLSLPEDTSHLEPSSKDINKTPDVKTFTETKETPEIPIPEVVAEIEPESLEQKMETIRVLLGEFEVKNIQSPADLFKFCENALNARKFYIFLSLIYPDSPVINLSNPSNVTLFHIACGIMNVNHNVLDSLLSYGENINAQTSNGSTPLHVTLFREAFRARIMQANERTVNPEFLPNTRYLINKGANVDIPDVYNRTPLDNAIFLGDIETVSIFLKEEIPGEVENRCLYTIKCILKHKPQYNLSPNFWFNLLDFSIRNKNCESFQYILSKSNIDLNVYGPKILCHAACHSELQCIKFLIDKGVNPSVCSNFILYSVFLTLHLLSTETVHSNYGMLANCLLHTLAPLHLAVLRQSTEIVEILLNNGADVNALTNHQQTHMVYTSNLRLDQQILDLFFRSDIIVGTKNRESQDALSYACKLGNLEIVKVLLRNGAKIRTTNTSTLHYALIGRNPEIVKIFLDQGLSVNCRSPDYGTPVEYVISKMGNNLNDRIIFSIFATHFAKVLATKKHVSIENQQFILNFNVKTLRFIKICGTCLTELIRMERNISPKLNFSFLDILSKDIDYLGGALKQEDITLALNTGKYKKEFVKYFKEMEDRIKEANYRRMLVEVGSSFFDRYLNKKIPFEISLIIFKNLSLEDLIIFNNTIILQ